VLRISQRTEGDTVVLLVEGRLAGPWVEELRHLLEPLVAAPSAVALEMAGVRFVDAAGERLLRDAISRGARLRRRSSFVAAVTSGAAASATTMGKTPGNARDRDQEVVEAVLAGDERAFVQLVERHHQAMIRVARCVGTQAVAEEVAQDAWVIVLRRLDSWEGRGSLKSWIFRIVANHAQARARHESRTIPFSALEDSVEEGERTVDEHLFHPSGHADFPGGFCKPPEDWRTDRLESREVLDKIREAIDGLPPMQRAVITLRDVAGCDSEEVCAELQVSSANQRVLLHRARRKVRAALDLYLTAA
jgi:RNA polymerase sigma-70 factor, ECF subfamily